MSLLKDTEIDVAPYVPTLQLTEGQAPPIAANGGLSYMSFDRDGDAGTGKAIEDALAEISGGEGQRVVDMIDKAPPGPIKTRAASGIAHFDELMNKATERTPEGRLVTIEEVGYTTAFLATDGAKGITGDTTYVDCGYSIIG